MKRKRISFSYRFRLIFGTSSAETTGSKITKKTEPSFTRKEKGHRTTEEEKRASHDLRVVDVLPSVPKSESIEFDVGPFVVGAFKKVLCRWNRRFGVPSSGVEHQRIVITRPRIGQFLATLVFHQKRHRFAPTSEPIDGLPSTGRDQVAVRDEDGARVDPFVD